MVESVSQYFILFSTGHVENVDNFSSDFFTFQHIWKTC